MSTHVTTAYVLAVLCFVVGSALAIRLATADDVNAERGQFVYLTLIPGFAGLMYVFMALDIGTVTVGSETIVVPRYIDWLITTPLLVGYVAHVAGAPRRWIAGVMTADAVMIVTGSIATVTTGPTKLAFFVLSGVFHLSLFYVLYAVLPKYAREHAERLVLFELLQNHIGLLWLAYPLVWGIGVSGLGIVSATGVSLIIVYIDVVAKVPYVYFVWNNRYSFDAPNTMETTSASAAAAASADSPPADD